MPTKEITINMTKVRTSYIGSLFSIFLFSSLLIATSFSNAQSIEEQQPISDPVTDYMNAIDNVEAEYSAYSPELSDLYLGLGKSLYSRQEYPEARQAFQRGMQIERVNNGLDSLSQSPYLLSIADTESFMGNWDNSQKALENLYSINTKAYGQNDIRLLPVLDKMLDFYLNSYDERTASGGYANLVISEQIGSKIYNIMVDDMPLDSPDAPARYRRLGTLQYFIANHIKQHGEPSESGVSFSTGGSARRSDATTSHMHFRRGKMALQKVVESVVQQEDSTERDQAIAVAELGDWYLVFGQRFSAAEAYQLAYDVLETAEQPELARAELFEQPRAINFSLDTPPDNNKTPADQLEVSVTISAYGVPQDIEVLGDTENLSKEQLGSLRRQVSGQRFRPKLLDGKAEAAPHIVFYDLPAPKG